LPGPETGWGLEVDLRAPGVDEKLARTGRGVDASQRDGIQQDLDHTLETDCLDRVEARNGIQDWWVGHVIYPGSHDQRGRVRAQAAGPHP
jgi:hypothetical protein